MLRDGDTVRHGDPSRLEIPDLLAGNQQGERENLLTRRGIHRGAVIELQIRIRSRGVLLGVDRYDLTRRIHDARAIGVIRLRFTEGHEFQIRIATLRGVILEKVLELLLDVRTRVHQRDFDFLPNEIWVFNCNCHELLIPRLLPGRTPQTSATRGHLNALSNHAFYSPE